MKLLHLNIPLFILVCSISMFGGDDKYFFEHLRVEDGLSQTTIGAIMQDHEGFMWFGTGNGLNKYDGYKFTIYTNNPGDSTTISADGVLALYEDKNNYIWIGTTDGILNRFDRQTETFKRYSISNNVNINFEKDIEFYEYPISFSRNNNNSITSIAEDNSGTLWISTWGKGLFSLNKNTGEKKHYYHTSANKQSISFNRIMKVITDYRGNIWVGTFGGGINKIEKDGDNVSFVKYKHTSSPKSLSDNKVISIFEDQYHSLWIGTYEGGLNKLTSDKKLLNPSEVEFVHFMNNPKNSNSISNNTVMSIVADKSGSLWIGTFGGGLNRFDETTGKFHHFFHDPLNENTLGDNDVLSLYEDASGILWIGTHLGEGISVLQINKNKFNILAHHPTNKNSLSDNVVWAFEQDKENNLWIATYRGGLNKYNPTKRLFTHFKASRNNSNSLSDNHIRSLAFDGFGNLWIGSYSGGLNCLKPNSENFLVFKNDPSNNTSIGANQIQSILVDGTTVWLGTFGSGLNRFSTNSNVNVDNIKFTRFTNIAADNSSLSDDRVYSLLKDRSGTLWVGTFGSGLNKAIPVGDLSTTSEIKFVPYTYSSTDPQSISDNRVMTIFEDSNGALWIGTYGGGLNKFDRKSEKFVRFSEKNGLTSGVVYGILEDNNKNLWMSTDNGLFKFNLQTELFTHYDLKDGIQSVEFSGGAYFKASDDEMFFGGINGVNYFYPDTIKDNSFIPPIVLTSVNVLNKPIKGETKELVLEYNQNFISFEFAALDFTSPLDNHFAYKLEGLEDNWQYVDGARRMVDYTNLSPGKYIFKVKGSNNDDVWNTEGASLRLIILPPLWKRWWFISFGVLLIGFIIYYVSTVRIKNQLAIEKLKSKLAADLHDNVGSGLTEISILSELAAHRMKISVNTMPDELKSISETARQLVDNMSDIVWVVNPKRDTLYDLIVRLKDAYSEMLAAMGITFKTSNLEKLKDVKLPMDFRQHLYLMFKEGINNSIKHSKCSRLFLDVNLRGNTLELILEDNGIGVVEKNSAFGNGLKNMESRAMMMGGKLKWYSSPDKGTTIIFLGRLDTMNKLKSLFRKNIFM